MMKLVKVSDVVLEETLLENYWAPERVMTSLATLLVIGLGWRGLVNVKGSHLAVTK